MGWWPFSQSNSSSSSSPSPTDTTTSQTAPPPPPPPPSQSTPASSPTNPDADFHAAFPHLAPSTPSTTTTSPTPESNPEPEPQNQSPYPTKMSCTAAFDAAFYCSSLGGHFNDIYRYGELRSCSEHWRDWRFCMGLSVHSKATQEEMISQHYREKEEKIRGRPNSEDVWDRRGPGEEVKDAFGKAEEEARRVEGRS